MCAVKVEVEIGITRPTSGVRRGLRQRETRRTVSVRATPHLNYQSGAQNVVIAAMETLWWSSNSALAGIK